jgi:CubicO group peptidase (beta-lactamase class C family)
LAASVALALPGAAAAQTGSLTRTQIARIRHLVRDRMVAAHIPGSSFAIGRGGKIVWSQGFGLADVENRVPATPETAYRTASIGKAMTATAAMQLVERGQLELDAPIQRYCPRYPVKSLPIKVRDLISHTSGIRHYEGPSAAAEEYIPRHYDRVSDAIEIFADDPLTQRPGADFHYTTWGYVVLGCVIEGASGQEFRALMRGSIFEPGGMAATRDDDPGALIPHRAAGYLFADGQLRNAPFADMSAKMAAGGYITTAPDLVRFMQHFMGGGYVSPATRNLMLTPYRIPGKGGIVDGFGMGWFLTDFHGMRAGLYGGSTAQASGYVLFVPDLDLAIAGLFNLENFPAAERAQLFNAIAEIVAPAARPPNSSARKPCQAPEAPPTG